MKHKTLAAFSFLAALLLMMTMAGSLYAEDEGAFDDPSGVEDQTPSQDDAVLVKKVTTLEFDETECFVPLPRPSGINFLEKIELTFDSLIEMRKNFEPEMKASVQALK